MAHAGDIAHCYVSDPLVIIGSDFGNFGSASFSQPLATCQGIGHSGLFDSSIDIWVFKFIPLENRS